MTTSRFRIEYQTEYTLNINEEKWKDPESSPDYPEMERMFSMFDKVLRREFEEVMPDDIYRNWVASNIQMIFGIDSKDMMEFEKQHKENIESWKKEQEQNNESK